MACYHAEEATTEEAAAVAGTAPAGGGVRLHEPPGGVRPQCGSPPSEELRWGRVVRAHRQLVGHTNASNPGHSKPRDGE
jgi:hypothetical protein